MELIIGILIGVITAISFAKILNLKKYKQEVKKVNTLVNKIKNIQIKEKQLERILTKIERILNYSNKNKENFFETIKKIEEEIVKVKYLRQSDNSKIQEKDGR